MMHSLPLVLAQTDDAPPPPALPTEEAPLGPAEPIEGQDGAAATRDVTTQQGPDMTFMWILIVGLVVFWIFVTSGQRKEKKKRAAMLSALKKGDKVQTVGGVIGTVVEVRENEVVVKVDENSNTRMRFSRSAIQAVMEDKTE